MFNDALENDPPRAIYAMEQLQKLYALERQSKEQHLSFEEIMEARNQKSVPLLHALGEWMKKQYIEVTPKSPIGKALGYSIKRWERLSSYARDGMRKIDNNPVENSIRPVAFGAQKLFICRIT